MSSAAAPLVSVVLATFNSRLTLACALDSVQRQTCQDFEVWVVGDACTDGTEATVAAIGDPRVHWVNLSDNSGSQAAPNNAGLRRARGRYVAYLGHDDLWFPWHLSALLDTAAAEGAAFVHGIGAVLFPDRVQATGPPRRGASYRGHFVPPTNWLVERQLLERIGPWRPASEIGRPVDVDVLDRLAASGAPIAWAPRLTTIKFPSGQWRAYAVDAPRPQIAVAEAMVRDPEALCARLLTDIASEHARIAFPTWTPPPGLLWREAGIAARRAMGATLRAAETTPVLSALLRWRYQRARLRIRRYRGLST